MSRSPSSGSKRVWEKCKLIVVALHTFKGDPARRELSFNKGDRLAVYERARGWYKGITKPGTPPGMIPGNYVRVVADRSKATGKGKSGSGARRSPNAINDSLQRLRGKRATRVMTRKSLAEQSVSPVLAPSASKAMVLSPHIGAHKATVKKAGPQKSRAQASPATATGSKRPPTDRERLLVVAVQKLRLQNVDLLRRLRHFEAGQQADARASKKPGSEVDTLRQANIKLTQDLQRTQALLTEARSTEAQGGQSSTEVTVIRLRAEMKSAAAAHERETQSLREQLHRLEQQVMQCQAARRSAEAKLRQAASRAGSSAHSSDSSSSGAMQDALKRSEAQNASLVAKLQRVRSEGIDRQSQVVSVGQEWQAKLRKAQADRDRAQANEARLAQKVARLEAESQQADGPSTELDIAESEIMTLQAELSITRNDLIDAQMQLEKLQSGQGFEVEKWKADNELLREELARQMELTGSMQSSDGVQDVELMETEIAELHALVECLGAEKDEMIVKLEEVQAERDVCKRHIQDYATKVEELELMGSLSGVSSDTLDKLERKNRGLEARIEELHEALEVAQLASSDNSSASLLVTQLQEQLEASQERTDELLDRVEDLEARLRASAQSAKGSNAQASAPNSTPSTPVGGATAEDMFTMRSELTRAQAKADQLSEEKRGLQQELRLLADTIEEFKTVISDLEAENRSMTEEIVQMEAEAAEIEGLQQAVQEIMAEGDPKELKEEIQILEREKYMMTVTIEKLESELAQAKDKAAT